MSRQRYEPIPQRDEVIILDNIHGSPTYNYNTAIPNSLASSIHTPSIAPSIPNSPPPSFHTHSPPGTPRPTPSTSTRQSGGGVSYAELWGVAPSTVGGAETDVGGTSNDALATIASLKQRIEWLEESIGKLLIEKDSHICSTAAALQDSRHSNCCVTFDDASPELERMLTQGKGSNCCVAFRSNDRKMANRRTGIVVGFVTMFMVCVMLTIILTAGAAKGGDTNGGRRRPGNQNLVPVIYGEDET
ncbi:uncharacterized protein LY89DRAFT_688055 [Mollisia scopiformis]|uniref:Uncharacterized protein n=1 Tax=Mollisia scopiformis TaxID=149040 RepID=A0A194WWF5_MOLSC|nr:uncharacterized protein LY89DRAFT_688055 [Mollisia scopiformis]KUJ12308.1 hypothetical protein LY89DRAFT_688055 [Mollisia scopiformis]